MNIRLTIPRGPDADVALAFVRHHQGDYNRTTRVWTLRNTPAVQSAIREVGALGMEIISGVKKDVTEEPYRVTLRKMDAQTLEHPVLSARVAAYYAEHRCYRIGGEPHGYAVLVTTLATRVKTRLIVVDWGHVVDVLDGDVVTRCEMTNDLHDTIVRYVTR